MNIVPLYQKSLSHSDFPQEDFAVSDNENSVVANGIKHDLKDGVYPEPSDSAHVAKLAVDTILSKLQVGGDFKDAFADASSAVASFNKDRELFINREANGFDFGATLAGAIQIESGRLKYAILDNCSVYVFDAEMKPKVALRHLVDDARAHYNPRHDWGKVEDRYAWRTKYRNNVVEEDGQSYGYGAIDGIGDFMPFLQEGSVELSAGDTVFLCTDGFEAALNDAEFLELLNSHRESILEDLQSAIYEYNSSRSEEYHREKAGYLIYV